MIILLEKFVKLNHGYVQSILPKMVPLWNGYFFLEYGRWMLLYFFDMLNSRIDNGFSCGKQVKDFKDPEVHHRHLSHLFGLFPGHTITFKETPALFEAAEKSLYKRGFHKLNNYITYLKSC